MIHHLSIAARDPKHSAEMLAEIMGGKAVPLASDPKVTRRFAEDERMMDLLHRLETWDDDHLGLRLVFVGIEAFERPTTGG
jgi:hypothetical protein